MKDGARDQATGRYYHDDLVISAVLAVFGKGKLNVRSNLSGDSLIDQIRFVQQLQEEQERKWRLGSY